MISIDHPKKIPNGAISALESELLKILSKRFDDCQLKIKRASNDGLPVSAVYEMGLFFRLLPSSIRTSHQRSISPDYAAREV